MTLENDPNSVLIKYDIHKIIFHYQLIIELTLKSLNIKYIGFSIYISHTTIHIICIYLRLIYYFIIPNFMYVYQLSNSEEIML